MNESHDSFSHQEDRLDPAPATRSLLVPRRDLLAWGLAALAAGSCPFLFRRRSASPTLTPPLAGPSQPAPVRNVRELSEKFFDESVRPLLNRNRRANQRAVADCCRRIDAVFRSYRAALPRFVDEVVSLTSQIRMVWERPLDWADGGNRTANRIRKLFEKHVFGPEDLQRDLRWVLTAFRTDLQANQNRLLVSVKVALSRSDLPDVTLPNLDRFSEHVIQSLREFAIHQSENTLQELVLKEFFVGIGLEPVVRASVTRMVAIVAPRLAGTCAAAGGSLAGSVGTSTAAGSAGGPAGAAIAFVIGLIVMIIVDWWISEQIEARLRQRLDESLRQIHHALLHGTPERPGLRAALLTLTEKLQQAQQRILYRILVEDQAK